MLKNKLLLTVPNDSAIQSVLCYN